MKFLEDGGRGWRAEAADFATHPLARRAADALVHEARRRHTARPAEGIEGLAHLRALAEKP